MPTVTVIVPDHNRLEFIEECLGSIDRQTRPPDEVILVDDASAPETRDYLASRSDRYQVLRLETNLGQAGARNAGLAQARGDLIAFLDSDDIWEPRKLEIQAGYMEENPDCDVSHTALTAFYEVGRERSYLNKPMRLDTASALRAAHTQPSGLMCRRDALRRISGFDARLRMAEDWDLSIRLAAAGCRIDFIPLPLARLRRSQHDRLTADWYRFLKGDLAVLIKHWNLYQTTLGRRGPWRQLGRCFFTAGHIKGRVLGRCMIGLGMLLGGKFCP